MEKPEGGEEPEPQRSTMSKKEQMNMIRNLFKTMVHGVSTERFKVLMEEALKKPFQTKTDVGQNNKDPQAAKN